MLEAETSISLGVIVVMRRTGRVLADKHPVLTPTTEGGYTMARAIQAYPRERA